MQVMHDDVTVFLFIEYLDVSIRELFYRLLLPFGTKLSLELR